MWEIWDEGQEEIQYRLLGSHWVTLSEDRRNVKFHQKRKVQPYITFEQLYLKC